MSESEEENENFCFYGKPLEPYDEDTIPNKRPISVEDQIATDAQGRRRFHGAFTGGFSAGFFNTAGSLEGWLPREYKSSRSEKARKKNQKPEDFMDEEDRGEFGIAPQIIKATDEYNTSKKRKKQVFSDGPIPGEPVLHQILTTGNETVGYLLLKNLGIKEKIRRHQEELETEKRSYGCEIPKSYEISEDIYNNRYKIPDIYKDYLAKPKDNTFGLGYKGLNKDSFTLFPEQGTSKFTIVDRKNKKVSITGQAFGVGAFEHEDDDIYMKEDMSKYDFELGEEKETKSKSVKQTNLILDMFICSRTPLLNKSSYPPPKLPFSFTGKHKIKKSRFETVPEEPEDTIKINAAVRAKYLGEETDKEYTESRSALNPKENAKQKKEDKSPMINDAPSTSVDLSSIYLSDKFVSSTKSEDVADILEPVEKMGTTHGTEQMRAAAKMKMFGPLTRITSDFIPCSILCKRFNVPEPFIDRPEKQRVRTKNLIFEYEKHVEEQMNLKPGLAHQKEPVIKEEEPVDNISEQNTEVTQQEIVKTEEEIVQDIVKDVTDKLDLDQKQDLFKAVFLSSDEDSEDDQEEDNTHHESKAEELKSAVLSDELLPKIKPIKEGILSGVNFHPFRKPATKPKDETDELDIKEETVSINPNLYGPRIPERVVVDAEAVTKIIVSSDEDEWVEKDKTKKKHKKEKKHKKDKHKKHKREKKTKVGHEIII